MELIYRGAEAVLYKSKYLSYPSVIKKRIRKAYRIKEIDEKVRNERIKREALMLNEVKKIIKAPYVFDVDLKEKTITMQYINGKKLKKIIDKAPEEYGKKIGLMVKKLHKNNIIHNDLTTSNMIEKDGEIYLIDFGLASKSKRIEDKAVDLLVLKKMLKSTHWKNFEKIWKNILKAYKNKEVEKKLEEIEKRARYA